MTKRLGDNVWNSDEIWKSHMKQEGGCRRVFRGRAESQEWNSLRAPKAARDPRGSAVTMKKLQNTATLTARALKLSQEDDGWLAPPTWKPAEMQSIASSAATSADWHDSSLPTRGDRVQLWGIKRRSELNGAVGELLSSNTDENGFLTVRVYDGGALPGVDDAGRRMKVHPARLVPAARSASSPDFSRGPGGPNPKATLSWKFSRSQPGNVFTEFDHRYTGRAESVWTMSEGAPSSVSRTTSRMQRTYTPLLRS